MDEVTISESKEKLEEIIKRATDESERIVIRDGEKKLVALVSLDDLAFLEEIEDRLDVVAYDQAMKEFKDRGGKSVPFEDVCRELGI
jgi:PHD/YefM family antitoxin component YafN of YafNO toxin-antitoxin module